jgi:flagellar hook-basal body protein
MGLSRALFAGISGLKGQQVKMDVIGNNIANVSTTGFKKSRVTFSDLFSDTLSEGSSPTDNVGGANPSQIGLGAGSPTIEQIMTGGATQSTGIATDLSISGNGFFVISDGVDQYYTRDGNFKLDPNGDLYASGSSFRLQGWMATRDEDGKFIIDTTSGLQDLNMETNRKQYAKATDRVDYSSNLDSASDERNIVQSDTSVAFKDNSSTDPSKQGNQKLGFTFQKIDGTHYTWAATETGGNVVATGELEFNDFGEIISSTVKGAGNTKVNYDWMDENYPNLFTYSSRGQIDPDGTNTNTADQDPDIAFNPISDAFLALSDSAKPNAFSFTYDPDGDYSPGRWSDPNAVKDLSAGLGLFIDPLDPTTGKGTVDAAVDYKISDVTINNNWNNETKDVTLQNYEGFTDSGNSYLNSGQLRVEIVPNVGGAAGLMDVVVYKNEVGAVSGNPDVEIGRIYGLDRAEAEQTISLPGVMSFTMSKNGGGWVDTTGANGFANNGFYMNTKNAASLNPTDNAQFFNGLPSGFHDGAAGPSKFEIRNVDASNSEYTGNLRLLFNSPTSFQIVDDNNVVLTTASLRDGEKDTRLEVDGISFVIHREGDALKPTELLADGFMGTEINLNGFVEASGKSDPVTVSVPKVSEINSKGIILEPATDIDFNVGFSKAKALPRELQVPSNAAPGYALPTQLTDSLNGTTPNATVTVDATKAQSGAAGSYKVEFGLRQEPLPANYDPYRPHDMNAVAADGEYLNNQVLKVYVNGESEPSYIIDLNPKTNDTGAPLEVPVGSGTFYAPGDTLPLTDQNGNVVGDNFMPSYNFFAEMENFEPAAALATNISNSFADQYESVERQIRLPNGVVINIANTADNGKTGTLSSNAYANSANFIVGDSYTFDVPEIEKAGIDEITTYSASFQQGAKHSTTIEVFDSLGGSHFLTTTYEHVDKDNMEWNYYLSLDQSDPLIQDFLFNPPPGYTVDDPKDPSEEEIRKANEYVFSEGRQGKLYFDGGNVDMFSSNIPTVKFQPPGSEELEIELDMNLVTEFEAEFGTEARYRTGNAMGLLQKFTIQSDGSVLGSFDNGNTAVIAQLAISSFNNPEGLMKQGTNIFKSTSSSGLARVGKAGADDRGMIKSGVLESSNVDLTDEFTDMIVTQRSFSANGRVITTSDEFLQEILQLKR